MWSKGLRQLQKPWIAEEGLRQPPAFEGLEQPWPSDGLAPWRASDNLGPWKTLNSLGSQTALGLGKACKVLCTLTLWHTLSPLVPFHP